MPTPLRNPAQREDRVCKLEFVADSRGVDWVRERGVVVINRVVKDTQVDWAGMEASFRGWARSSNRVAAFVMDTRRR